MDKNEFMLSALEGLNPARYRHYRAAMRGILPHRRALAV
jgi:hypothetical protein